MFEGSLDPDAYIDREARIDRYFSVTAYSKDQHTTFVKMGLTSHRFCSTNQEALLQRLNDPRSRLVLR